ncbi:MAG: NAD-dependent epimerase/dehydratase family protein, partial [Coriobacteriia bacterium]|nr:NAD-dependent epimerase/dehydratase family protein [Coriobacteriia bacterium]
MIARGSFRRTCRMRARFASQPAAASRTAQTQADPALYVENNLRRPVAMMDALVEAGVGAIVFSSTAATYGEPESIPIAEDAPTHPVN